MMKNYAFIFLLALTGLAGACNKDEPVVLMPTSFSIQVSYERTGLPVDSAIFIVTGVKGSYLQPPVVTKELFKGYTDANGRISGNIQVPSDYYAYFDCGSKKIVNSRLRFWGITQVQPYTDELKRGKENNLVMLLDTLK